MKVFIVSRGVPSKSNLTLGIFEFDQAKALAAAGCEVVFLSLDLRSLRRKRKWGFRSYVLSGVCIEEVNVPVGAVPPALLTKIGSMALKKLLKRAVAKHGEPDIVHSHFINISDMASRASAGRYRHVITEHSSLINTDLSKRQIKQFARIYSKADAVIAVSTALCKRMNKLFGVNPVCINNIVDTSLFKLSLNRQNKDNLACDTFNFVVVANLTANKRIELVVSALAELIKEGKNVSLTIVGEGEMRRNIEAQIEELQLVSRVKLTGKIDRSDLSKYLAASDCFVLASMSETFGVAYIEAMVTGLPVIATKCGGPEDFVTEENGILIERDKLSDLTSAMRYMYHHAKEYDKEKISKNIAKRFDAEAISAKLVKVYESLV